MSLISFFFKQHCISFNFYELNITNLEPLRPFFFCKQHWRFLLSSVHKHRCLWSVSVSLLFLLFEMKISKSPSLKFCYYSQVSARFQFFLSFHVNVFLYIITVPLGRSISVWNMSRLVRPRKSFGPHWRLMPTLNPIKFNHSIFKIPY